MSMEFTSIQLRKKKSPIKKGAEVLTHEMFLYLFTS